MSLHRLGLFDLQNEFTRGTVSATEIATVFQKRLTFVEPKIKAYITPTKKETLLAYAEGVDRQLRGWRKTMPLMAMPIAIKDNICTEGVKTTCGSRILENFVPPYDATVIARLRAQQYCLIGKTNLDEFAMGSSTENSAFGPTRNPWNPAYIPGGSSGGSAAAVAADLCVAALGSDTGGSIRQPAACCGVVGLKPTYGRVSRYGLVAFASSLDQIGTITKDVRDAAILLKVIAGRDPLDSTSADLEVPDYMKALKENMRGMKVGVPKEFFTEGMDPEVEEAVRAAIEEMKKLKAEVQEISLPTTQYAIAAYYLIAPSEASSNLARYDGVRYGFRATKVSSAIRPMIHCKCTSPISSPFLLTWPVSRPSWCPAASAAKNCRSACRSLDAPLRRRRSSVRPMHMSRPRIGRERGQTLHDHRNRSRHYCARCDRAARIFRAAIDSAS